MLEVILEALPVDEERQLEWKVWLAFWGRAAADERLRYEQEQRYVGWRGLLDKLVRRARPGDTAADRCAAVDLIAGAIDGWESRPCSNPRRSPTRGSAGRPARSSNQCSERSRLTPPSAVLRTRRTRLRTP